MPKVEIDVNTLKVLIEIAERYADNIESDGDEVPPVLHAALLEANALAFPR